MGADIYLRSVSNLRSINEDEGYFRDSYNSTSLFWVLGLSWWKLSQELLDEKGCLPIDKAKELLARFETGDMILDDGKFDAWVEKTKNSPESWNRNDFTGENNTVEDWKKYFKEKHASWCELLRQSIELNEPLYWST